MRGITRRYLIKPTYKIELLTQSIMATFQLPSAVDPAVRMALTRSGWSEEIFAWILCKNSYHMAKVSISKKAGFVNDFQSYPTFYALPATAEKKALRLLLLRQ